MTLSLSPSCIAIESDSNYIHRKPKQLVVTLTAHLVECVHICAGSRTFLSGGPTSTINFYTLLMAVKLTINFEV